MEYVTITKALTREPSMFGHSRAYQAKNVPIVAAVNVGVFDSTKLEIGKECRIEAYIDVTEEVHCGYTLCITPQEMRSANDKEIAMFKEKLLEHNLCISEVMLTARDMNKTTFVERICYHDKDKVLFNCQGQTLTLKDVEKVEPPKGMNFSYVFDNGYSYYGADVTTKEKWLSGISSIISRGPIVVGYKSGYRGCLNGVIDVTFTKESYHVVSNS